MMHASKANKNVSERSKTGLCIKAKALWYCHESHLNVTGSNFSGYKFERKSHIV